MPREIPTILLVEDDPNDVFFLGYAFEQAGIRNPLVTVEHGQRAIDYLNGKGKYADRSQHPFPCIILLDLKMPGVSGMEVLRWIKEQPHLGCMIVIVLSSSNNESDIQEAYRLGARSYLVKPVSIEERLGLARAIKAYWLELNMLPRMGSAFGLGEFVREGK